MFLQLEKLLWNNMYHEMRYANKHDLSFLSENQHITTILMYHVTLLHHWSNDAENSALPSQK